MDGHFVPNLSFGPDLIPALRKGPAVHLDAHLMVEDPRAYAPLFARGGADWVTFHLEACPRPRPLMKELKRLGVGVGLAIKPKPPAKTLIPFLDEADLALVMTVEPGFGGQGFLSAMLPKIRQVREAIDASGRPIWLQVDGGINAATGAEAAGAGADSLVAGSAIFKAPDPAAALREIGNRAQDAFVKRNVKEETWR
jgi:ribulose-phosphate 3-epimerase